MMISRTGDRRRVRIPSILEGERAALAFRRFVAIYERRYSSDQPRVPAGEPGAGQFAEGVGNSDPVSQLAADQPDSSIVLAGGFGPGDANKTVQEFMSAKCIGSIRGEISTDLLDKTIREVQRLKNRGDSDAGTCILLLSRDEYRK